MQPQGWHLEIKIFRTQLQLKEMHEENGKFMSSFDKAMNLKGNFLSKSILKLQKTFSSEMQEWMKQ